MATPLSFEPPGPGSWMLDRIHHGHRPLTRFVWPSYRRALEEGMPN